MGLQWQEACQRIVYRFRVTASNAVGEVSTELCKSLKDCNLFGVGGGALVISW